MSRTIAVAALLLAMLLPVPAAATAAAATGAGDPYIVVLAGGGVEAQAQPTRVAALLDGVATRAGAAIERRFDHLVAAFATHLSPGQARALAADPQVAAVVPDEPIELTSQSMPTGVARIGDRTSTVARIDGVDERVDADVAIVDTGIDATHPDLNVVGGINCSSADRTAWRDDNGHGTHVAGTVAALDNDIGVVGVAPGARLWAVRILDADGSGLLSWYLCGLDWIAAQRDPSDASRPLIEAVNMSVAKWGSDDGACGSLNGDLLHAAICRLVAGGITVVAAAANDSGPASLRVPAAYDEVITVSALADTDGRPGGLGGDKCWSWGGYDVDDTFADFSNYGPDVDLIAPGKCIWSTKPGNTYGWSSGTSMAAPHVTGAVALYKASRPAATPAEVKRALQYLGSTNWAGWTDPDGAPDLLLDVSRIGPLGSVSMTPSPASVSLTDAGGSSTVTLTFARASVLEELTISVTGAPAGMSASLDRATLFGFEATTANLTVTVTRGLPSGTYPLAVRASWHGTTATATVPVVITEGVTRLAGPDRYATAAAISAATFAPGVPVVYVATGLNFPDALAGAAAAGHIGAPLLLVATTTVPTATVTELARLKPKRIVVLGSTGVVAQMIVDQISGFTTEGVTRLAGPDRYATAAAISAATFAPGVPVVYVATGLNFPDALAGAAAAGHIGAPLLLVATTTVPTATVTELARLKPKRIVVLGSTGVVAQMIVDQISGFTTEGVTRLAGPDRYATAAAISAATFAPGVPVVYVATGLNFPDALAGAAAAGHIGAPLLLVATTTVPTATVTELARLKPKRIVVLGGSSTVSTGVAAALLAYVAG